MLDFCMFRRKWQLSRVIAGILIFEFQPCLVSLAPVVLTMNWSLPIECLTMIKGSASLITILGYVVVLESLGTALQERLK